MKIYEWGQLYFGKQDLQRLGQCHWCRYILPVPFMTLGKWGSVYVWVQWGHLYMSFILQLERWLVQYDRVESHHSLYGDNVTPLVFALFDIEWLLNCNHLNTFCTICQDMPYTDYREALEHFFTHRGLKDWHFARGQMQNKGLRKETSSFNS